MYMYHEKRRSLWLPLLLAGRAGVRQPFPHRIERGEKVSELVRAVCESREKALSHLSLRDIVIRRALLLFVCPIGMGV